MTRTEPDWAELVPEVTLRAAQREALAETFEALYVRDLQVVLLEAPTGIGKSIIQLALMRYEASTGGTSFMATPQRALQDQMRGWRDLAIMKGRSSYSCNLTPGLTAARAPCRISSVVRRDHEHLCSDSACPFYSALVAAKGSSAVVHNYASLMAQVHISNHFGPRSLICLDEGHTAVNWIRNYIGISIDPNDLGVLTSEDPPDDPVDFAPWFRSVLSGLDRDIETGKPVIPEGTPDALRIELLKVFAHAGVFGVPDSHLPPEECGEDQGLVPWATLRSEPTDWHEDGLWSIVPIKVRPIANTLLGLGSKVLIVTATVLNPALFRLELGIDQESYACIRIGSAFDKDNRPIVKRYAGRMSSKHRVRTMPRMVAELRKIAADHPNEPGLIHTVSHSLSYDLCSALGGRLGRPVVQLPRGSDRDEVIRRFLSGGLGPAAILVGPSMLEGVDGKDGSCRWQAMCKVPWMYRKDPVVSHLLDSPRRTTREWGGKWYSWKAAQQTVQGVGRVCRSHVDYGVTYLMDEGFDRVLRSGYVPRYVLDAVTTRARGGLH